MRDQGFEFPTQRVTLYPIDHEGAVAGACCHAAVCVDEWEIVADEFPAFDKVIVGCASCDCKLTV